VKQFIEQIHLFKKSLKTNKQFRWNIFTTIDESNRHIKTEIDFDLNQIL